jgi:hypothetical protein
MAYMVTLEQVAQAALDRDSLRLRSLVQDFLKENPRLGDYVRPAVSDARVLSAAAALMELLASRQHQAPPAWTSAIGPLPEPFFLLKSAETLKHLRILCETQAPEPLRRRRLYAPPNFLAFA